MLWYIQKSHFATFHPHRCWVGWGVKFKYLLLWIAWNVLICIKKSCLPTINILGGGEGWSSKTFLLGITWNVLICTGVLQSSLWNGGCTGLHTIPSEMGVARGGVQLWHKGWMGLAHRSFIHWGCNPLIWDICTCCIQYLITWGLWKVCMQPPFLWGSRGMKTTLTLNCVCMEVMWSPLWKHFYRNCTVFSFAKKCHICQPPSLGVGSEFKLFSHELHEMYWSALKRHVSQPIL